MDDFSFGEAIGAGFRVIGRNPLAVLIWAAAYLLLVGLPALAFVAHVIPVALAAAQDAKAHMGHPDPAQVMAWQAGIMGWQPAIWLLSVVATTLLMGAMFRAVLQPEARGWGYLRLGRQELWLGLTYLVLLVMGFILMFVLFLPMAIASGVMAAIGQHGGSTIGGVILLVLAGLAGTGAIVWVLLRLSLALPMSFAQGRFLLYESWDLTRGQTLKMFGVYVVLAIGLWVFEAVCAVAFFAVFWGHLQDGAASWSGMQPTAALDMFHRDLPAIIGAGVVASVVLMAIHAIFVAPLAEIYRELTAAEPANAP
jgi:hypothetical protein